MLVGPKYKICKRLGASVFEKCQTQKFQLAEARSPRRISRGRRGGGGAYGTQLLEKQKARFTYGLSETQFSRYAKEAMEKHGADSSQGLVTRLESRLDNVVFRAGFVKTRRAARQLVSHGHITLNGKRMNIPSCNVATEDIVAIRQESRQSPLFADRAEASKEHQTPKWLIVSEDGHTATMKSAPVFSESELSWSPAIIIQFYSR
ncbi:hypothetical protein A3D68_01575 [Candidatus Adlerbacteria bacterium RIFCSPHIGHO2_02_FULL_52_17]|uniref:Small ribosomal subunit protein uS4 n=1 Tax=Candidatus Adlerbacteria bacterium RIFCSPHIGHO2_02_FULL_52_17 TaxID=1797240 RepID=A0A1F4XQC1_9BACT|nr:MAG: hypothetical protein A3D68_01575 [Candidatus Adlerbacteria bacterium RIFCSPHIGHO2_02_FULL_52_17]